MDLGFSFSVGGLTTATLRDFGKIPDCSEEFTI